MLRSSSREAYSLQLPKFITLPRRRRRRVRVDGVNDPNDPVNRPASSGQTENQAAAAAGQATGNMGEQVRAEQCVLLALVLFDRVSLKEFDFRIAALRTQTEALG